MRDGVQGAVLISAQTLLRPTAKHAELKEVLGGLQHKPDRLRRRGLDREPQDRTKARLSGALGTFVGITVYWLPVELLVLVPPWFALRAMIRHAPRTSVIAGLSPGPVLALLGGSTPAIAFGILGGLVVAFRHLHEGSRVFTNG